MESNGRIRLKFRNEESWRNEYIQKKEVNVSDDEKYSASSSSAEIVNRTGYKCHYFQSNKGKLRFF